MEKINGSLTIGSCVQSNQHTCYTLELHSEIADCLLKFSLEEVSYLETLSLIHVQTAKEHLLFLSLSYILPWKPYSKWITQPWCKGKSFVLTQQSWTWFVIHWQIIDTHERPALFWTGRSGLGRIKWRCREEGGKWEERNKRNLQSRCKINKSI